MQILKGSALAAAVALCVAAILLLLELRMAVREVLGLTGDVRAAVAEMRTSTQEQLVRLKDPRNSKALDAAIQTAAVFNATGRLVNTQVIPRAMRTLDNLDASAASLNRMIAATDRSVNGQLLPEITATARQTATAIENLDRSLQEASQRANASLDDIHRLAADPAWSASLQEFRTSLEHIDGVAANLEQTSRSMPTVAASIEKIAATSAKYRKAILWSQILSAIGRAFF